MGPGEREGYGGPRDVTSLSLSQKQEIQGVQGTTSYTIGRAAPLTPATGFRRRGDFFGGDGRGRAEDAGVATLPAKRANCA